MSKWDEVDEQAGEAAVTPQERITDGYDPRKRWCLCERKRGRTTYRCCRCRRAGINIEGQAVEPRESIASIIDAALDRMDDPGQIADAVLALLRSRPDLVAEIAGDPMGELIERLEAFARDAAYHGDMTPTASRMLIGIAREAQRADQ